LYKVSLTYIFNQNLQLLNRVIIKIKTLLPQTYLTFANFGYPLLALWLYCSLKLLSLWLYCSLRLLALWLYCSLTLLALWLYCSLRLLALWLYCSLRLLALWLYCSLRLLALWLYCSLRVLALSVPDEGYSINVSCSCTHYDIYAFSNSLDFKQHQQYFLRTVTFLWNAFRGDRCIIPLHSRGERLDNLQQCGIFFSFHLSTCEKTWLKSTLHKLKKKNFRTRP
jgi:hypothetical protein